MSYISEALQYLDILDEAQSSKSAINSSMRVLLTHMLKCKYQNNYEHKSSWRASIKNSFENMYDQFPRIGKGVLYKRFYLREMNLEGIYQQSRNNAAEETGLPLESFPEKCEWTREQLIDFNFITNFINTYGKDNPIDPNQLSLFDVK